MQTLAIRQIGDRIARLAQMAGQPLRQDWGAFAARIGLPVAIFSLKSFMGSMLALYLALSIGLSNPYWAMATAYIVAQPLAGAVISKAIYRAIGTLVGAAVAVIIVPVLVNAPELLSLAFALWLGFCVFVSLLDPTPRSYMFVLAGYSACIVGLPAVLHPAAVFDIAALRVQEILFGIICGSLVHAVVLPGSVTKMLLKRVDASLRDAERWTRDAIARENSPKLDAERRRLALDITELHNLSTHLPYETSGIAPRIRTVRSLQDQLSMILPLGAAVDDRMERLARRGKKLPRAVQALVSDTCHWLADMDKPLAERHEAAEALRARAAALEPAVKPDMPWDKMLILSLLSRLSTLIACHRDCRELRDQMLSRTARPVSPRIPALLEGRRNRELHRDYGGALRGAFGAMLTLLTASALWIASGWVDGAYAVTLAGVFMALFARADDPRIPMKGFLIGTVAALMIGAVYIFGILPRMDGFPMFAMALAPALLVCGAVLASPRYGIIALAILLGLSSENLVSDHYHANFTSFMNSGLSQLLGIYIAMAMAQLTRTAGLDSAINRTIRAGWRDIATRANLNEPPNMRGWVSRMHDRIALLAPRLAARGDDPGAPIIDALRDLRNGIVIGELRQLRLDVSRSEGRTITPVLKGVGDWYGRLDVGRQIAPGASLLRDIDHAFDEVFTFATPEARRASVLALVSLRRNLYPDAEPYHGVAA